MNAKLPVLLCLPNAGASAAVYSTWRHPLSQWANLHPLELPGRGSRIRERLIEDMDTLVTDLARDVLPRFADRPVVIYGHSMGAILAFELARALRSAGHEPSALVLTGAGPPHLKSKVNVEAGDLSDGALIAMLRRLGGTPAAVLVEPDLLKLILPILRSDLRLLADYRSARPRIEPQLSLPIDVVCGADDKTFPLERLSEWQAVTAGPVAVEIWPGAHFFVQQHQDRLLALLGARLQQCISQPG